MPIHNDSSIIPDSTTSSSPIMTPAIKRATRTYGRSRPTAESPGETDLSFSSNAGNSGSQSSLYRTGIAFSQEEVPPSSEAELSFSTVNQDDEESGNENDASSAFAWDWRQKLKEIDEQDDFDFASPKANKGGDASVSRPVSKEPSLSPQREKLDQILEASNSPQTKAKATFKEGSMTTLPPHSNESDSDQSPIRRTVKRRTLKRVESEGEEEPPKSTPQSEDPSFAFTPPTKDRNSPTPPTSDEDEEMPSRILPKSQNKGKGKALERPGVVPLELTENVADSSFGASGKKLRTKRPTKKDLIETVKARTRLLADQNPSIPRVETSNEYSMMNFLAGIAGDSGDKTMPSSQPSDNDTIKDFSSDVIQPSPQIEPWQSVADLGEGPSSVRPMRKLRIASPSPLSKKQPPRNIELDSDEELPDVSTLSKEALKPDLAKLAETKRRLADQMIVRRMEVNEDSDDDLQIVGALDMQTAFKMEEKERKAGRRKSMPESRKRQLQLAAQSKKALGGTQDNKKRGVVTEGFKSKQDLNASLFQSIQQANRRVIEDKEARWSQLGGTLKKNLETTNATAEEVAKKYAEEALKSKVKREGGAAEMEEDEEDDDDASDLDWEEAEADRGSTTPSPSKPNAGLEQDEGSENIGVSTPPAAKDDDQEMSPVFAKAGRAKARAIVDSDEEDENRPPPKPTSLGFSPTQLGASPLPPPAVMGHRGSLSSVDDRTEDDGDKENDNSRIWDRSEDKENKAVARHLTSPRSPFGERKPAISRMGSLAGSFSWSPGISPSGRSDKAEDRRKPFQDLLDADDPFSSPARSARPSSFLAKLHESSPAAKGRPSAEDENSNVASSSRTTPLEPSFSDLFESGTAKQPVKSFFKSPGGPLSGLAAAFSDDEDTAPFRGPRIDDELGLTQDVALEPAFHLGTQAQRRADQIFEKEQEYLIEAAAAEKLQKEPTLYVDEIGFLTQTKPNTSSPEVYRQPPTPSQFMPFTQTQSSARKPLRTLSFTASSPLHSESPAQLTRLRKRSKSPTSPSAQRTGLSRSVTAFERPPKNAFDALKEGAIRKEKQDRKRLEKSEFIEGEAQESDDDELAGFGLLRKKDDDEEDGEDLDQDLHTLVDNHKMDENEENAELVLKKFQEQAEQDDAELEQYHQKAVQGEFRKKRRGQGLGLDDSDDSDLEDDAARLRRKMHKRPRIDREDINELGKHTETAAFYNTYHQDLTAAEDEFDYLKDSQPPDVMMVDEEDDRELASDDEEGDENARPRERQTVSAYQVQQELKERAQLMKESTFDASNLDWMNEDEDEDEVAVKTVTAPRLRARGAVDGEASALPTPPSTLVSERSVMWAKQEGRSRTAGTTGRSVGGAAVTGHRAKSGGSGSVRGSRSSASASSVSKAAESQRKPLKAQKSVLGTVAAERSARFK